MDNTVLLKEGIEALGLEVDDKQISQLINYKNLLIEWNEKINLTAITEERDVYIKHFHDSFTCILTGVIKEGCKVIDVGTGAGFPGVPVKILRPDIKLTLLDSLNKRILYLNDVINKLELNCVEAVHGRAEEAGANKQHRESYDIAFSRAVAAMNILCEYCLPFVKVGGYFVCQKGPGYKEELEEAKKAIEVLGGKVADVREVLLPFSDIRHYIIVIEKIGPTPAKYPRKPGKPTSNPIV